MTPRKIKYLNNAWEELIYHQDALLLDPLTSDLALTVDLYLARWEEVSGLRRQVRRDMLRAQAIFANTNYRADKGVLDFIWDFKHADREGTRLKNYLTLAPSRFIRRALGAMAVRIKAWIPRILLEPEDSVKRHAPILEALSNEATAAVEGLAMAKGKITTTRVQVVDDFLDDVNAFRLDLQGELQKRAAANGLDGEWIKMFFRPAESGQDESNDEAPEAPAETTPTEIS